MSDTGDRLAADYHAALDEADELRDEHLDDCACADCGERAAEREQAAYWAHWHAEIDKAMGK